MGYLYTVTVEYTLPLQDELIRLVASFELGSVIVQKEVLYHHICGPDGRL